VSGRARLALWSVPRHAAIALGAASRRRVRWVMRAGAVHSLAEMQADIRLHYKTMEGSGHRTTSAARRRGVAWA